MTLKAEYECNLCRRPLEPSPPAIKAPMGWALTWHGPGFVSARARVNTRSIPQVGRVRQSICAKCALLLSGSSITSPIRRGNCREFRCSPPPIELATPQRKRVTKNAPNSDSRLAGH